MLSFGELFPVVVKHPLLTEAMPVPHLDQLAKLNEGILAWNAWRKENEAILGERGVMVPNLTNLCAHYTDLTAIDLSNADLRGADLDGANLSGADLSYANLQAARLELAKLRGTNLRSTLFLATGLNGADVTGAKCGHTKFVNVDLSEIKGLESVVHAAPSSIGIDTVYRSRGKIPNKFLHGCGVPGNLIDFLPSLIQTLEPIQFYSCFISYSHQDEDFSQRLHSRMEQEHLSVWYAAENMKGGRKIHAQLFDAIRLYDKLLLVLSEASMASEWVRTEIRRARKRELEENRQIIFPIRLVSMDAIRAWECFDADTGKDLAVEIREYHIPDFSGWKYHDQFEAGFAKLLGDLRAEKHTKAE